MNRYENYLETGYEWIGKIPSSWELSRVGKYFTERSEKVDDVTYPPLSVTMNGIVDQLSDVAKSNDNDNRKLVKKDDFVINSRSDRKGSSGIAPRDGSVSLINIVLAPKNIDPKYIENLFKSYYFKEEYFRNGKGIHWDLWTTRWEQFKNISIPIPPIEEQKLISRYLDKKTSQIDSLVENIQKKIELLKEQRTSLINHYVTKGIDPNVEMKDSGVEWIGEIPKQWNLIKLSHYTRIIRGSSPRPAGDPKLFGGDYIPWITVKEVTNSSGKFIEKTNDFLTEEGCKRSTLVKSGTLLFSNSGATLGVPRFTNLDGCINDGSVAFLDIRSCVDPEFLYYFLGTQTTRLREEQKGFGQPNLNTEIVSNIKMPLPTIVEQRKIVVKIEETIIKSDAIIKKEENRLKLFSEYRQSLISSAVTGKVRVTEDMA